MSERWEKWEPLSNLANMYYAELIEDDIQRGFFIELISYVGERHAIEIRFPEGTLYSYRIADEGRRLQLLNLLDEQGVLAKWSLFRVYNSEYMTWIEREAKDLQNLQHFAICTIDPIIEVLVSSAPIITQKVTIS